MADLDDEITSYKVVLIGEKFVGKTNIISRFTFNSFDENTLTTGNASYSSKVIQFDELQKKNICLEIWDTIGQEQYRSLTKIFYKDASSVIFVYDITSENTFKEIKDYWYEEVMKNYSDNLGKI